MAREARPMHHQEINDQRKIEERRNKNGFKDFFCGCFSSKKKRNYDDDNIEGPY